MSLDLTLLRPSLMATTLLTFACGFAAAEVFDAKKPVAQPTSTFRFDTITPFLKFSAAYGERNSSAHGTFGQIGAQMASPSHTHSAAYHGIVIHGVMTNSFSGDKNPPQMGPGSHWYVPGNAVHMTACVSKEPCLFYIHSDAKYDYTPAD
jgi:quercetin dioxygenase-like cupin family protein